MPTLNPSLRILDIGVFGIISTPSSFRLVCRDKRPPLRHYATGLHDPPSEGASVAVLGGGITGLVSAYNLSINRPDIQITLFEGSNRLGGWLQSNSVDVRTGKVVFEQGPRNLRPSVPNGRLTLDLVSDFVLLYRFDKHDLLLQIGLTFFV